MLAKSIYLGYYPLGGDLEIDGIRIMQFEWKNLAGTTYKTYTL